jgi:fatty acid desaturase
MTAHVSSAAADVAVREIASAPADPRPRGIRRGDAIRDLKKRDNITNFAHIGFVYLVIVASVGLTIWSYGAVEAAGLEWWWNIPTTLLCIAAVGASQHQFGGIIHEGTHFTLFENKTLNEAVSDWLGGFPIYTSTFQYRLHHLAHHQFINDPLRDPDWAQLEESGHDLDFPITHVEMLKALGKQLWLPNLFRYMIVRARYSALGTDNNPYMDRERRGERLPTLAGVIYAVTAPAAAIPLIKTGHGEWAFVALAVMTAAVVAYFYFLDENKLPHAHVETVISHRATNISRIVYMAIVYTALTAIEVAGWTSHAWDYYGLLWILPLFTTFPLFMIMRQWVQHGNADRGRYTNTRVFLVNPFIRYAVFPFGMDYHLPHHIYASVPHYKLKGLHELLLQEPQYRDKGIVVEGYFNSPHGEVEERNPTVIEVLGDKYAPTPDGEVYVDTDTLEYAKVSDATAIQRENEASSKGK